MNQAAFLRSAFEMSIKHGRSKIIVILGPTASGKSDLAVKMANKFNGEIISADSRQIYKGLNIGSGKISKKEMRGIPHHLLDVASPKRTFTVAEYQKLGETAIRKILSNKKLPIIVGGTGFYIDSLIYGYKLPRVMPNPKLRKELEKKSAEELFKKLKKLDPKRAENIDRNNKRRLVRALEILITTGKPIPEIDKESKYEVFKIGIKISPEELKKRIKERLLKRLREGMVDEVEKLHRNGLSWKRLEDLGLEYRYVGRFLRETITKETMIELLEQEIWHYAKRQMTWWKRDKEILWLEKEKDIIKKVLSFL